MTDVILTIAEVESDAPRDHRPAVREAAQAAHHALLEVPADDPVPGVDRATRHLIAARAAWVDRDAAAAEFYLQGATGPEASALVQDGPDGEAGVRAPRRVRAALRQVDLLITRPAAATGDDLNGLLVAGWSAAEIVVIEQIVGLVSYQTRVAHALRVLDDVFGEDA
ncbi:hypothetical protein ASD65_15940 [Microbacterium sp. Root61]|uniref:hypothetical protein n=1 Tax=Microbacterium sp. Root61 TaxID=1736570 RepID=UPI0006F513CC|nr:hypothetical protein [Microbacterium sp. Root61]KRA25747.1 hypothetical protein ASD65_15940 [Microbacterium sp. Root61]